MAKKLDHLYAVIITEEDGTEMMESTWETKKLAEYEKKILKPPYGEHTKVSVRKFSAA